MKRLVAAAAALLIAASTVDARVLVTYQRAYAPSSVTNTATTRAQEDKHISIVTGLLDRLGVDYAMVPPEAMRTEFARTGVMVWGYGTAGAKAESFNSVIIVNALGKLGDTTPAFNPESLTFSSTVTGTGASHGRGVPSVPVLEVLGQIEAIGASTIYMTAFRDSSGKDSTGVTTAGSSDIRRSWTTCQLITASWQNGTTTPWWNTGFTGGIIPNPTPPAGGFRSHVRVSGNTASTLYYFESDGTRGSNTAAWLDSMEFSPALNGAGGDTIQVWERPMSHVTGAKPIVFAYPFGRASCLSDSTFGNALRWPCEYDIPALMFGIARLDSLTGGQVIRKPLQAAPVVVGAFARSGYRNPGGIAPDDTASVWATLDSLRLNCPKITWTIGANVDSVTTYISELSRWKGLGNVRFTPWNLRAISDTTKGGAGYGGDAWGRYRPRYLAVGPYNLSNGIPQDSSLYSMLRFNRDSLARVTGTTPSRCAVAPMDDWTPKNALPLASMGSGSALSSDSILYAVTRAGFSALVYNAQRPFTTNTMIGYKVSKQGPYVSRLGSGTPFTINLWAHSGFSIRGSWSQQDMRTDSVLTPGSAGNCNALNAVTYKAQYNAIQAAAYEGHRWWYGMTLQQYRDYDFYAPFWIDAWDDVNTPKDDVLYDIRAANIIRLSAQDFGSGGTTRPNRPGYWAIKSLYNAFEAMNRAAGRPVAVFTFPEEMRP